MDIQRIHDQLKRDHAEVLDDPRYAAEGLDRAACPPLRTYLARLAAGAACRGLTAENWRDWVRADAGADADELLDSTEKCMRAAGLWPWAA